MTVKPIRPNQVSKKKSESIPDEVLTAVNDLIAENFDGRRARVVQDDIIARVVPDVTEEGWIQEPAKYTREELFSKGYLDFEDIYRKAGWDVTYDKPGYNESYKAFFIFEKK